MDRPLQIGILGCARIARRGVIAGIQQSGVARLHGISSRQGATAQAWAEEFGIPRAYGCYDALIDDPDIDAVYNPLPNELHREWTLKAAARGKHILCEKPLALDYAEAETMVAECRRHGVILMEAFMWRHHPRVTHARQMLSSGHIGELLLVKMDFSFEIDRHDWRLDPRRGGGALFDIGCYGINAARLFTGAEPTEVFARGRFYSTGVDMTLGFELRFPGDVIAQLNCSFECPYRNRIELVGTKGVLEFPDGVLPAPQAELMCRTESGSETVTFAGDQYAEEIRAFCAGIAAGKLPAPAEDGLANMKVLCDVLESARSGRSR